MRTRIAFIGLAAALLAACGSYTAPAAPAVDPPDPTPEDVAIVQGASVLTTTAFDPNPRTVTLAGGESAAVRWVNQDGEAHQIVSDDGAFDRSGTLGRGATYRITLGEAGTYRYHCAIHPNMVGSITVTP